MSLEEKRRVISYFEYALKQLDPEWTIDGSDVKDALIELSKLVELFPALEYCEDYQRVRDILNSLKNPLNRVVGKSRLYELAEHSGKLIEKAKALLSVEENRRKTYKKSLHSFRCPNCNAEMPINAKYCGICGNKLKR